jgi:hypothetical protein
MIIDSSIVCFRSRLILASRGPALARRISAGAQSRPFRIETHINQLPQPNGDAE